jgi:hypothetical protein
MSRKYGTAPWDDVFAGAVASHAPVSDLVYVHRTLAHHKQRSAATIHPMHAEVAQRPRFIGKSCSGARLSIY